MSGPPRIRSLGGNVGWTLVDVAISAVTQLAIVGEGARVLGAAPFGIFTLVTSITLLITGLQFTLGFTLVGAAARVFRDGAEEASSVDLQEVAACHRAFSVVGVLVMLATLAAAAGAALAGGARGVGGADVGLLVLLTGTAAALGFATAGPSGVVRGATDYRLLSLSDVGGKLVVLALVVTSLSSLGLPGLGLATLLGQLVTTAIVTGWCRRRAAWFRLRPLAAAPGTLRRVLVASLPLLAVSLGSQLVSTSDVVTVSAFAGASATAQIQFGSVLPGRFTSALFQAYDVAFPYLAASRSNAEQERTLRGLTRAFGILGGLGLGLLALYRTRLGVALAGATAHAGLADTVQLLICGIVGINIGYHGLALLVISRQRQSLFTRYVTVEVILNIGITIPAVLLFGAAGAAAASLTVVGVFNLVAQPLGMRSSSGGLGPRFVIVEGLGSVLAGAGCAAVGAGVVALLPGGLGLAGVLIAGVVALPLAVGAVALLSPQLRELVQGGLARRGTSLIGSG